MLVKPTCIDVPECKRYLASIAVSSHYDSMNSAEIAALRQLVERDTGQQLVPILLDMLDSNEDDIPRLSAYALGLYPQLPDTILQRLIAGVERDIPWLDRALAAVQTDASARFAVQHMLHSTTSPGNQITWVVIKLDRLALPYIIGALRDCAQDCLHGKYYILQYALTRMPKDVKQQAAKQIGDLLKQQQANEAQRWGLLQTLKELGTEAVSQLELIRTLKLVYPASSEQFDDVLLAMAAAEQLQILRQRLQEQPNVVVLRQVAELAEQARELQPDVLTLLQHPDRELRRFAVTTLGMIGDEAVLPVFQILLGNPTDVLLHFHIAKALTQLQLPAAAYLLDRLRTEHWYPPVQQAAAAITAEQASTSSSFNWPELPRIAHCQQLPRIQFNEDRTLKLYPEYAMTALADLQYQVEIISYGAKDKEEQRNDGKNVIVVNAENIVKHVRTKTFVPDAALKTSTGWLLAGDRGEWGGELMFRHESTGKITQLLDENTEDIYKFGTGFVAIVGLGHLGTSYGRVYKLTETTDGAWDVELWRVLPGNPRSSWLLTSGELHVGTSGGSILISPDGDMSMAVCAN